MNTSSRDTTIQSTTSFAWAPSSEQIRNSRLRQFMDRLGVDNLDDLQTYAREHLDDFWRAAIDDIGIGWTVQPTTIHDTAPGLPWTRWWAGGRLNLAENAAERWARSTPHKPAIIWEGDDATTRTWSYRELAAEVAHAAGVLRQLGVGPGDAVGL